MKGESAASANGEAPDLAAFEERGEHAEAPWRRAELQREEGHVRLQHLLPGAIFSKRVSNDFLISVKFFCALLP